MNYPSRKDPLDELFRGFFVRPVEWSNTEAPGIKIDVKEEESNYVVHAELPGVKKEDIQIEVDGATVSLSAERKQEKEVKEGERLLRTERYFGKVARSFQLGHEIDETQASARYNDGVLELVLPKRQSTPTRRLVVE